ncbi:glycoside hydrolase family 26 protein [Portibacter lacus]|uniref:Mannan endo-1,4-beta-mannosidase n=1 Tax=Portibacter lacus TaxID=1099794 RepID=A0AA37SPD6_9BACT|nr:glycosyl hydrolase [Portibacter lacus]GLR17284.1 mannan endo-1,4-beta-mannosidase [Portibacter lacus]
MNRVIIVVIGFLSIISCERYPDIGSDSKATKETKKLYAKLHTLSDKGIMVGHQDALAYGVGWRGEQDRCDMHQASGKFPGVVGYDIGHIFQSKNINSIPFDTIINLMAAFHEKGGVNTICWHMKNPYTGGSSWDTTMVAADILPGGEKHNDFLEKLEKAATFFNKCKIDGKHFPIIFRPFHEHNGDWFWWGRGIVSEEEYISLFRFMADYFKNTHDIHHLIYAFSPDQSRFYNKTDTLDYLYGYPGDDYVDILGIDNYADMPVSESDSINEVAINNYVATLELITEIAAEKGKIAALTETGFEGVKDAEWFTKRILNPILTSEKSRRLSYMVFWRNDNPKHHYMVYPGHMAQSDFQKFVDNPLMLTLEDL